jgi:hypothetical protein
MNSVRRSMDLSPAGDVRRSRSSASPSLRAASSTAGATRMFWLCKKDPVRFASDAGSQNFDRSGGSDNSRYSVKPRRHEAFAARSGHELANIG